MATTSRSERPLTLTTPLGPDVLLLAGFTGREAISQLFHFQLDLLAENERDVPFEKLLGQQITVELSLPGRSKRHFNGIVSRFGQGARDATFTTYHAEVVPWLWLLTRKQQSRIFQHISVPDIVRRVFEGRDVSFALQGSYEPRVYCVQYRETDFNFASRLMEEEGIFYFFQHTADGHRMVVADTPQGHPDVPSPTSVVFDRKAARADRPPAVFEWEKAQELRSGRYRLRDHHFQLPRDPLEAQATILESVPVGRVTHKLRVGGNAPLEIYDYPGEYAERFDGIDRLGREQPQELQKIFADAQRTVGIRMQQEALPSLVVEGASTASNFVSGHRFALERHFNADGQYVLTSVEHSARLRDVRSEELSYANRLTCIPADLPFRPPRVTPRPLIPGAQTAIVVGPPGEEIFTDKFGRVKVQFHWDREGRSDADSSGWIRVAALNAGTERGFFFIPRIGQEVVVAFEEGDPDRPIIIGSVYNPEHLPLPRGQLPSPTNPSQ